MGQLYSKSFALSLSLSLSFSIKKLTFFLLLLLASIIPKSVVATGGLLLQWFTMGLISQWSDLTLMWIDFSLSLCRSLTLKNDVGKREILFCYKLWKFWIVKDHVLFVYISTNFFQKMVPHIWIRSWMSCEQHLPMDDDDDDFSIKIKSWVDVMNKI